MSSGRQAFGFEKVQHSADHSPYYKLLNMKMLTFTEKECFMSMEVEDQHMNINGKVHGGVIASLADSTCNLALTTVIREGEFIATQSLDVNYIAPASTGILKARGWVVHRGRYSAISEADVFDEAGTLIAHAHTVHAIRKAAIAKDSEK